MAAFSSSTFDRLFFKLSQLSSNKENPFAEWEHSGDNKHDNQAILQSCEEKCICGNSVINKVQLHVTNKISGKILLVGPCCIGQWRHDMEMSGESVKMDEITCGKCSKVMLTISHFGAECPDCEGAGIFKFGKYKGQPIIDHVNDDLPYIEWYAKANSITAIQRFWINENIISKQDFSRPYVFRNGKHKDKTLDQVYLEDRGYLSWFYKNTDGSNDPRVMKWYRDHPDALVEVVTAKMYFGKYKGKTLDEIWPMDEQYVRWIVESSNLKDKEPIIAWAKANAEKLIKTPAVLFDDPDRLKNSKLLENAEILFD